MRKRYRIVFLGPDSSGKTTLIEYIKKQLEAAGKDVEIFIMGWKDFQNPILRILSKIYLKRKSKRNIKEKKLARFKPRSWFFYTFYYFELWSRYLRVLFSKKKYILMDRYFYDELAFAKDLKFKFFKLITPKPDICFILRANNYILRRRGENISKERLEVFYRNLNRIRELCKTINIDSSKPLNKIYIEIKKYLFPKYL